MLPWPRRAAGAGSRAKERFHVSVLITPVGGFCALRFAAVPAFAEYPTPPITLRRLLDMDCAHPNKADRSPQALQKPVESEVVGWSSVLKGAPAVAN